MSPTNLEKAGIDMIVWLLCYTPWAFTVYLTGAFIANSPNPADWGTGGRFIWCVFAAISACFWARSIRMNGMQRHVAAAFAEAFQGD